jgi:hypothetical protein
MNELLVGLCDREVPVDEIGHRSDIGSTPTPLASCVSANEIPGGHEASDSLLGARLA